jgi:hypothetical protein
MYGSPQTLQLAITLFKNFQDKSSDEAIKILVSAMDQHHNGF